MENVASNAGKETVFARQAIAAHASRAVTRPDAQSPDGEPEFTDRGIPPAGRRPGWQGAVLTYLKARADGQGPYIELDDPFPARASKSTKPHWPISR